MGIWSHMPFDEAADQKRLEEFEADLRWQSALVQLERNVADNNGASRIIDALAEQIMAKTALFAAQRIGQAFQWLFVRADGGLAASCVVKERIDRLLQHPSLMIEDDLW